MREFMQIVEGTKLLLEASDAPLYHVTNYESADMILDSGSITAELEEPISMTRDRRYRMHSPQYYAVQFVFDGRKLKQSFKITPYDWFEDGPKSRSESEENVWAPNGVPVALANINLLPINRSMYKSQKDFSADIARGNSLLAKARDKGIDIADLRGLS